MLRFDAVWVSLKSCDALTVSMRTDPRQGREAMSDNARPLLEWMERQYLLSAAAMLRAVSATELVCEFRRKPAGDSDFIPATVPI